MEGAAAKRKRPTEAEVTVVLVSPKEDGNVGAVARAMSNFDSPRLILVAPRAPLGDEAQRRAMAGYEILRRATIVPTVAEAIQGMDLVVGTTDLSTGRTESYLRRSMTPREWGKVAGTVEGRIALLLGPEDNGLDREELRHCEVIVTIPTSKKSPTLNLSHAAAVLLYETFLGLKEGIYNPSLKVPVSEREKKVYFDLLDRVLTDLQYPVHKRRGYILLSRRLLGRALASEHEVTMMLGFMRKALRMTGRIRK